MFGTSDERRILWQHMREPVLTACALLAMLGINVGLGATLPFPHVWIVELLVAAVMVATILLVSMEVRHEPPLVKLFAGIGFFWVGILFTMTLVDYLSRA
ncbi:oxidase [Methylobacterium sp. EM32]|uniref:oxidase n=1 Tax=Methylobacterium sp. EM32 TaxID=3163481 RepID=UPI00339E0BF5